MINITSLTILSASLPRSQTNGFRSAPRARGCAGARCGKSNHDHPKRPHDANQLAKSTLRPSLVELGLKARATK